MHRRDMLGHMLLAGCAAQAGAAGAAGAFPREVVDVAVSVILFCTVASFLPAWRAARMDPVTALRKE